MARQDGSRTGGRYPVRAAAAALVLALLSPAGPDLGGAEIDPDLVAYRELLRRYRAGDVSGAVGDVASWPADRLLRTAPRIWPGSIPWPERHWDVAEIGTAVLLHMDVALAHAWPAGTVDAHIHIVRGSLSQLRRLDPLSKRTADLHLALAIHLQGQLALEALQAFLGQAAPVVAGSGPLLLAEGTLHEALASPRLEAARAARLAPSARASRADAERALREALRLSPGLTEARLRLGHVVIEQGRVADALPLLAQVLVESKDPRERYFAHLFLGEAHVRAGHPDLAEPAFAEALDEEPCGQAAAVARAHLAFGAGRTDEAQALLAPSLARAAGCNDPWAHYDYGQAEQLPDLIAELRRGLGR